MFGNKLEQLGYLLRGTRQSRGARAISGLPRSFPGRGRVVQVAGPPRIVYPNGKPNSRRLKRLRNRLWKRYAGERGVAGRVKTHDHFTVSFKAWEKFGKEWFAFKKNIVERSLRV